VTAQDRAFHSADRLGSSATPERGCPLKGVVGKKSVEESLPVSRDPA
jgi:hypothetical protein